MDTGPTAQSGLRFEVKPSGGALGADVFGFPFRDFTPDEFAAVRAAWARHQVLRFRGIDISDADQIRFSAQLGKFVIHPRQLQEGTHGAHREILVISNLKKADGTPAGDLGNGEVNWHTDTWFVTRPPSASILRALQLPPRGGNTYFLNMYTAYETLPETLKQAIDGRYIHHQKVIDGRGDVRMNMTRPPTNDVRSWPGVPHPIVRTHPESGRQALYLGGKRRAWIIGMEPAASTTLLDALWNHVVQKRFVWAQEWRLGDMVMWDNRCVMHRRDAFDPASIRLMHRTAIEGERPV